MNETMKKSKFTELIRSTRLEFDSLLEKFTPAQMTRAGAAGDWLIKDILAHITWHEREMIGMLEAQALRGSELWNLPLDQRNAVIHAGNKDRPLEEVRAEARQVFLSLVEKLEALSEEALNDAGHFAEMPADWQPWSVIASNTYELYQDHLVQLQNWGDKFHLQCNMSVKETNMTFRKYTNEGMKKNDLQILSSMWRGTDRSRNRRIRTSEMPRLRFRLLG